MREWMRSYAHATMEGNGLLEQVTPPHFIQGTRRGCHHAMIRTLRQINLKPKQM